MKTPIEYYENGKMKYHSEFHQNHNTEWITEDEDYLISWYDIVGAEEMSFALERPLSAIYKKVSTLRKKKIMKKPVTPSRHKRMRKENKDDLL